MEGAPHRGEISETNGGDALLLDDLGLDVDVCDVRKGKAAVARVTAFDSVSRRSRSLRSHGHRHHPSVMPPTRSAAATKDIPDPIPVGSSPAEEKTL